MLKPSFLHPVCKTKTKTRANWGTGGNQISEFAFLCAEVEGEISCLICFVLYHFLGVFRNSLATLYDFVITQISQNIDHCQGNVKKIIVPLREDLI